MDRNSIEYLNEKNVATLEKTFGRKLIPSYRVVYSKYIARGARDGSSDTKEFLFTSWESAMRFMEEREIVIKKELEKSNGKKKYRKNVTDGKTTLCIQSGYIEYELICVSNGYFVEE